MVLSQASWSLSTESSLLRDRLVQFWLCAPADQIENLWNSSIGFTTKTLVSDLKPNSVFTAEQISLRNSIGDRLNVVGLNDISSVQLMIANFLLSPPGLMKINNADSYFPSWFSAVYKDLYEGKLSEPSGQVQESPTLSSSTETVEELSLPDFGPFPHSIESLSSNRIHLNRLLGLSNLFYIDPDDDEVAEELLELRSNLARIIISCPEDQLERFWSTDLGDRYWSLVRSGIQQRELPDADMPIKSSCLSLLDPANGGFANQGAINALLVLMMYFMPGTMKVPDAQTKLPAWLFNHYDAIFQQALPNQ